GCAVKTEAPQEQNKLSIVTTLFPQYDFAKELAGDLAEVTLLLPPGAESHSYEPTPADIIAIHEADLFIYTGEQMEAWVPRVLKGLEKTPKVLDVSKGILLKGGEVHGDHVHDADPHIFTSLRMAAQMVQNLEDALAELDSEHSALYRERGAAYRAELAKMDEELVQAVENAKRKELIFGGRFAFLYFAEDYGLSYASAYDSCAAESEPSPAELARLIDRMRQEQIPVVYYEELTDPKTARLIAEETGAKPLLLHSCHNVSKEELTQGATYLSLMQQNIAHIKEGLG
ncbi:MAG: zinc ABC transporter substrate-binding protein, partial [Clostridia bacterium]|nr:zinc ABC transporter substrate-binding protein [Clostridia bacterium]